MLPKLIQKVAAYYRFTGDVQGVGLRKTLQKTAGFKIAPSKIHGQGVFADGDLQVDDDLGLALEHTPDALPGQPAFRRTELGKFLNHAHEANAELYDKGNGYLHVRVTKPVQKSEEITLHYPSGMKMQEDVFQATQKKAFATSGGLGAGEGQAAVSPDPHGVTPQGSSAGPDVQLLDQCEIEPDDKMFDLALLKAGFDLLGEGTADLMPEVNQGGPSLTQGIENTRKLLYPPPDSDLSPTTGYQESGASGAGGKTTAPTGLGVLNQGGGGAAAAAMSAPVVRGPVTQVTGSSAPMQGQPFIMGVG